MLIWEWSYFLVDGAPLKGTVVQTLKVTDPTLPLGEVQCCNADLTKCTRKDDRSHCLSGDNDSIKYSYGEAEGLCQQIEPIGTWDLCPRDLIENKNQEICQGLGCQHDNTLVWVKKETTGNLWKQIVIPSAQQ